MIEIGKESASTSAARVALPAQVVFEREQSYSPVILPLGSHSSILDAFGGGSGTVAIDTWPTDDVFGARSRDGRIRIQATLLIE